jgi:hypothetical protein
MKIKAVFLHGCRKAAFFDMISNHIPCKVFQNVFFVVKFAKHTYVRIVENKLEPALLYLEWKERRLILYNKKVEGENIYAGA